MDGEEDGCRAVREAYACVASDEFVTALASTSSSSHESCKCLTANMDELQIAAAIEKSKQQGWSELQDGARDGAAAASACRAVDEQLLWEQLKKRDPRVFKDWGERVKLGRLIAEGGQAHIYEASVVHGDQWDDNYVAKVFKMEGFSLAELQRQWPRVTKAPPHQSVLLQGSIWRTVLGGVVFGEYIHNCCSLLAGTFLEDGRFAFVITRYWCDLRTLVNLKLIDNKFQGPPFSYHEACRIMRHIAQGMNSLHDRGVLHRDLKAANVLIEVYNGDPRYSGRYSCHVADYESSMLVQGTGFWRAPEVLEDLLKKPCDRNAEIWTEKVDVYSYAMTSYEVLTGHIPFYGYVKSDWKRIIDGERPHLPDYIDPKVRELVKKCWHNDPLERPTFEAICDELKNMLGISDGERKKNSNPF